MDYRYIMGGKEFDSDILNGLFGVSSSVGSSQSTESSSKTNPKYVIISFFTGSDKDQGRVLSRESVSNPTIYEAEALCPKGKPYQEWLAETLKEHIKKYGAVTELIICGHGATNEIGNGNDRNVINIPNFLTDYSWFKRDFKIETIGRVVFDGCNTFSKLNEGEIQYYSEFAKAHNIQIVGTTSVHSSGVDASSGKPEHTGRHVQFTPNGLIVRDKLDKPRLFRDLFDSDTSWTEFYVGHTAEEGKQILLQQKNEREAETKRQILENKLADYGPKF